MQNPIELFLKRERPIQICLLITTLLFFLSFLIFYEYTRTHKELEFLLQDLTALGDCLENPEGSSSLFLLNRVNESKEGQENEGSLVAMAEGNELKLLEKKSKNCTSAFLKKRFVLVKKPTLKQHLRYFLNERVFILGDVPGHQLPEMKINTPKSSGPIEVSY